MTDVVRRHVDPECPDVGALSERAESEGYRFVKRAVREWQAGTNRFSRPGEGLYLAWAGDRVIGVCGVSVDPYLDDSTVARLRHVYVHPEHRRRRVAAALVARCLADASATFGRIRLRTSNPIADSFYRSIGFEAIDEQDATHAAAL
jgi:GNAT superfamily N-acetyltransferase